MTKIQLLFGNSMPELIEKMDDFFEGRNIISSPIYQEMVSIPDPNTKDKYYQDYQYYCVVYYKSPQEMKELNPIARKPASKKQLDFLKTLGYKGNTNLTSKEAFDLITEIKEKKK